MEDGVSNRDAVAAMIPDGEPSIQEALKDNTKEQVSGTDNSDSVELGKDVNEESTASTPPPISMSYSDVPRYDRISPFDSTVVESWDAGDALPLSTARLLASPIGQSTSTTPANATDSNPFRFAFTCTANQTLCDLAKTAFVSAGYRIGKSLQISQPIIVSANFYSFCRGLDGKSSCSNSTASRAPVGRASPSAYFAAKPKSSSSKMYYFYPQALVKQLSVDASPTFSSTDILAEFNSDVSFYYASSGRPIGPNEIDLEFVIAHELTHGLDYSTFGQSDPALALPANTKPFLAPGFFMQGPSSASANVINWQPLAAFDSVVADSTSKESLAAIGERLFRAYPGSKSFPIPLKDFIQGFATNKDALDAGALVQSIVTRGNASLTLNTAADPNLSLKLNTPKTFQPGTSISHADFNTYFFSPDFLMIPAVGGWAGTTLDGIIQNVTTGVPASALGSLGSGGILRPSTLAVLNALGWSVVNPSFATTAAPSLELNKNPSTTFFDSSAPTFSPLSIPLVSIVLIFTLLFQRLFV
ncbi:hypothetical protein BC829DRAFT_397731 [Chytridium lagenaria]|nr:hypothetical protein BC829DRAFT_397731 [Chytridium lagenaria]